MVKANFSPSLITNNADVAVLWKQSINEGFSAIFTITYYGKTSTNKVIQGCKTVTVFMLDDLEMLGSVQDVYEEQRTVGFDDAAVDLSINGSSELVLEVTGMAAEGDISWSANIERLITK